MLSAVACLSDVLQISAMAALNHLLLKVFKTVKRSDSTKIVTEGKSNFSKYFIFWFPCMQVMARIEGNAAFKISKKEAEIAVEEMMVFLAKAKVNMKINK